MTYLNLMNNVLRRLREEEVTTVNESTYSKMVGDFINDAKTTVEQSYDWSALRKTVVINTPLDSAERPVGDVSGNGDVRAFDASLYSGYVAGTLTDQEQLDYINNVLNPWALDNMASYNPGTSTFSDAILQASLNIEPQKTLLDTPFRPNTYSLTGSGDDVKIISIVNDKQNCFVEYQTKAWFDEKQYINSFTTGVPLYYTFSGLDDSGDTRLLVHPRPNDVYFLRVNMIKRQASLSVDGDNLLVPSQPVIHLAVALLARERGETGGTSTAEYFAIADKYLSDAIAIDAAKHPEEMIFRTI